MLDFGLTQRVGTAVLSFILMSFPPCRGARVGGLFFFFGLLRLTVASVRSKLAQFCSQHLRIRGVETVRKQTARI